MMCVARRPNSAVAGDAFVGRKLDRDAAALQHGGERLGREQMAAGAPGGDEHHRRGPRPPLASCHQAGLPAMATPGAFANIAARGRSRQIASSIPMP